MFQQALQKILVMQYRSCMTQDVYYSVVSRSEFREPLLTLADSYFLMPVYFIIIPRTFRGVVSCFEFLKKSMLNMLVCHFHYSFEKTTLKIKRHSSKFALNNRGQNYCLILKELGADDCPIPSYLQYIQLKTNALFMA